MIDTFIVRKELVGVRVVDDFSIVFARRLGLILEGYPIHGDGCPIHAEKNRPTPHYKF